MAATQTRKLLDYLKRPLRVSRLNEGLILVFPWYILLVFEYTHRPKNH